MKVMSTKFRLHILSRQSYPEVAAGMSDIFGHFPSEYISAELRGRFPTPSPPAIIRILPFERWAALALASTIAGNEIQCW